MAGTRPDPQRLGVGDVQFPADEDELVVQRRAEVGVRDVDGGLAEHLDQQQRVVGGGRGDVVTVEAVDARELCGDEVLVLGDPDGVGEEDLADGGPVDGGSRDGVRVRERTVEDCGHDWASPSVLLHAVVPHAGTPPTRGAGVIVPLVGGEATLAWTTRERTGAPNPVWAGWAGWAALRGLAGSATRDQRVRRRPAATSRRAVGQSRT